MLTRIAKLIDPRPILGYIRSRIPMRNARRYPIKKDEYGRSARRRCFELFDQDKKPPEVIKSVGISLRTANRYYADFRKKPGKFTKKYDLAQCLVKMGDEFSLKTMRTVGETLGMTEEEVAQRLERPWGLLHLLQRKWFDRRKATLRSKAELRLENALIYLRGIERLGLKDPEQIKTAVYWLTDWAFDRPGTEYGPGGDHPNPQIKDDMA